MDPLELRAELRNRRARAGVQCIGLELHPLGAGLERRL
jgi:hypothetical protein